MTDIPTANCSTKFFLQQELSIASCHSPTIHRHADHSPNSFYHMTRDLTLLVQLPFNCVSTPFLGKI